MTSIPISAVRVDGGTQSRVELNEATVAEYAEALLDGAVFPPIVVFVDGERHWLASGFHRLAANEKVGNTEVEAEVREGTQRDALMFSLTANATHGLNRTNADKRKAVTIALADPEWSKLSARDLAKLCGVSHNFVAQAKRELSSDYRDAKREALATLKGKGKAPEVSAEAKTNFMTFENIDDEIVSLVEFIRPRIVSASLGAMTEVIAFVKRQAEIVHGVVA